MDPGEQVRRRLAEEMVRRRNFLRELRGRGGGRVQEAGDEESAEQCRKSGAAIQSRGARVYALFHREIGGFFQSRGIRASELAGEGRQLVSVRVGLSCPAHSGGGAGGDCSDSGRLGGAGGLAGGGRWRTCSRRRRFVRRLSRAGWITGS